MRRKIEDLPAEKIAELESDWRAGLLSLRVLAAKYRLQPDALRRFAEKCGWPQRGDLRGVIDAAATSALVERAVSDAERAAGAPGTALAPDARETVQKYGQIVASVVEGHKTDIAAGRRQAAQLQRALERLLHGLVDEDAISGLAAAVQGQAPDLAALLLSHAASTKERLVLLRECADVMKSLAVTQRTYIELERQAWGLDKAGEKAATYDDFLAEFYGEDSLESPSLSSRALRAPKAGAW